MKSGHTGPKSQLGGDQKGLINCEYQLYVFIFFYLLFLPPNSCLAVALAKAGRTPPLRAPPIKFFKVLPEILFLDFK